MFLGDPLKISEAEDALCDEIEKKLTEQTADGGKKISRSQRHRRGAQPGVASVNQVAAGLGERLKPLTPQQLRKAKEASASKRAAEAAQRAAQVCSYKPKEVVLRYILYRPDNSNFK